MLSRNVILTFVSITFVFLAGTSLARDYFYDNDRYYDHNYHNEHADRWHSNRYDDRHYNDRYDDRYDHSYDDRDNHHREDKHESHQARAGWDVDSREARGASNCYRYSLYAENGRGSARIMSLPGKNYIQVSNGEKSGYVCFSHGTTLELGKLANPGVSVEFRLEHFGTFAFGRGQKGSEHAHNWFRSYYGL